MRALVTGAGGFVGAHLVARLASDGWGVVAALRPGGSRHRLEALGVAPVDVVETDLADPAATTAAVREADPDVAFLLAATRSATSPAGRVTTTAVNGTGPARIVDALPDRCRAVVALGSSTEYGEVRGAMDEATPLAPRGFFGATKAAGSLLLAAAAAVRGVRSVILRPFQVYGPLDHPDRLVPTALRAAVEGRPLALTEPGRRRDWVFVDDVVEACVRAGLDDRLPAGQAVNLGTGRQVANEELVATLEAVTGLPIDVRVGAHAGREWDARSWVSDPTRARALLGWEATVDLAAGLTRCWEATRP